MISRNQIYDEVSTEVSASRDVYCASRLEPVPESFPACFITEISHYPSRRNVELQHEDEQLVRDYEVHTFSNLQNDALSEAYEVMADAESSMKRLGFIETYCGQTANIDATVVHVVARFTRVFGDADTI